MKKSMKKVDKIVTWLIIGWAVASIFWVASQTKKWKEVTAKWKEFTEELTDAWKEVAKKWFSLMGKGLVKVISLFDKDKK
jgi:hypothetical protein